MKNYFLIFFVFAIFSILHAETYKEKSIWKGLLGGRTVVVYPDEEDKWAVYYFEDGNMHRDFDGRFEKIDTVANDKMTGLWYMKQSDTTIPFAFTKLLKSDWCGYWGGTIGKKPVTALIFFEYFVDRAQPTSFCLFLNSGKAVELYPQIFKCQWVDSHIDSTVTSVWHIDSCLNDKIFGYWTKNQGRTKLPLRLSAISDSVFYLQFKKFVATPVSCNINTFNGKKYRALAMTVFSHTCQIIEILDTSTVAKSVNHQLRSMLPISKNEFEDFFGCAIDRVDNRIGFAYDQLKNSYSERITIPCYWDDHWLSVKIINDGYCQGCANGGHDEKYRTWDLRTGKEVDPLSWIKDCERSRFSEIELPRPLEKTFYQMIEPDSCGSNCMRIYHCLHARMGENGLVFSNCDNLEVEFSFNELLPFMTREGRRQAELIIKENMAADIGKVDSSIIRNKKGFNTYTIYKKTNNNTNKFVRFTAKLGRINGHQTRWFEDSLGRKEGQEIQWYDLETDDYIYRNKYYTCDYHNGKKNGKAFFFDKSGSIISEETYKYGIKLKQ